MSDYPDIFMGGLKKSRRKVNQDNRRTYRNSKRLFYKHKSTRWTHHYHCEKPGLIGMWSKEQQDGLKSLNVITVNQKATPTCSV